MDVFPGGESSANIGRAPLHQLGITMEQRCGWDLCTHHHNHYQAHHPVDPRPKERSTPNPMEIPQHVIDAATEALARWRDTPAKERRSSRDIILEAVYPLIYAEALRSAATRLERVAGAPLPLIPNDEVHKYIMEFAQGAASRLRAQAMYIASGGTLNGPTRASRRARLKKLLRLNWNGRRTS